MHYAVYADTIYGIGTTIEEALADAGADELVNYNTAGFYPDGAVVDFTTFHRCRADDEDASGHLKIRRIDPALYVQIEAHGADHVRFEVAENGVLVGT